MVSVPQFTSKLDEYGRAKKPKEDKKANPYLKYSREMTAKKNKQLEQDIAAIENPFFSEYTNRILTSCIRNFDPNYRANLEKGFETQNLTYLADEYTPQISEALGIDLRVTSRWRPPSDQSYGSMHSVGRAMDIGMSGYDDKTKIKIVEAYLQSDKVQAIGTSDVAILKAFSGNNRIVDERSFDKEHGTNHNDHLHITSALDTNA